MVAFSSFARIWGEGSSHFPPVPFFFLIEVEISLPTPVSLFRQDESIVAELAEMIVAECSLTNCIYELVSG